MQTATTQRAVKARTKAPAPFSATAAKLIQQVQAEAREQLLAELSTKDAIIVLHGFDSASKQIRGNGTYYKVEDAKGNSIRMSRRHTMPESWLDSPEMHKYFHPARWDGSEKLVDAMGREWERDIGVHVCDDFGNLVQVAE